LPPHLSGKMAQQAIVVGGGLAGVSTANSVLEHGGKVVLVDKSAFCGGNSTKATSGINGAETRTQKTKKVEDSVTLFTNDTLKGGAKRPELVKVLCGNSGPDVDWLVDKFDLDMSLLARLGGHSAPRTHRGKERFPGMTITYALIQLVENISERTDLERIINKAKVKLLLTKNGTVCGLVYEKKGKDFTEEGPVILATGGFGADFTENSLLAKYRPDLMHLPTTNGDHTTGDGIKMGEAIGAASIDLEWVQVHPTGLVEPDDPEAKIKFLAAEALRGVGGLVFDADGKRFCNELGRRDYVTGEMWKNKAPFRLCLNKAASNEFGWAECYRTGLIDNVVFPELEVGDLHPGGQNFDPLNFADKYDLDRMKLAEIKHARLSMAAWLGFLAQAFATNPGPGLPSYSEGAIGPYAAWLNHVSYPWVENAWKALR